MSASTLTAFNFIGEDSLATPGLFNRIFSTLSDNIGGVNSVVSSNQGLSTSSNVTLGGFIAAPIGVGIGSYPPSTQTQAGLHIVVNSNQSQFIYFVDSSGQRSSYAIGQHFGLADGLQLYDVSGDTMIANFSKQSIRFFQNVVGPVYDTTSDYVNVATIGTGSDSTESRINAAIVTAAQQSKSGVLVSKGFYPYSASSISFIHTLRMIREGGSGDFYDIKAYGAYADGTRSDTSALEAARDAAKTNAQGGVVFCPADRYVIRNFNLGINDNNVTVRGETPYGGVTGTVFYCPTASGTSYCAWIHHNANLQTDGNGSGFDGIQFESDGAGDVGGEGTGTEYGVVISSNLASLRNCSVTNFQHGLTAWGLNANKFEGCRFTNNSRIGVLIVDPSNLTRQVPSLQAHASITADDLGGTENSIFHFTDCRIRVNLIGMVVHKAIEGTVDESVLESNYRNALILWDSRDMLFRHLYLENNNRKISTLTFFNSYYGLRTSTLTLNGSVNGTPTTADERMDILIGETTESQHTSADSHLTRWNTFEDISWTSGSSTSLAVRVRSGFENIFIRPQIKDSGTSFFCAAASAMRTNIVQPFYRLYGTAGNTGLIAQGQGTQTKLPFGTWTPTFDTAVAGGTCTYSRQNGRWSLDVPSRTVTAQFDVKISANNLSGSGVLVLKALPFAAAEEGGGALTYWETMATNWSHIGCLVGTNSSSLLFYGTSGASVTMTNLARTDIQANTAIQGTVTYQLAKDA